MRDLGFHGPLYFLPFDHRSSFQAKLFGWSGAGLDFDLAPVIQISGSG